MIGFSAEFVRREIKAGELVARLVVSRSGKMGYWRIHIDAAKTYAIRLTSRTKLNATDATDQNQPTDRSATQA